MLSVDSLVSAHQLNDWLFSYSDNRPACIKILKAQYKSAPNSPGVIPNIVVEHPHAYIPNSIGFDLQGAFSDTSSTLSNTMLATAKFQQQAQKLGLNNTDTLIVYDDFGNFCASRVWFMFKSVGFNNVFVLDGGFPNWLRLQLPTVSTLKSTSNITPGNFTASASSRFRFVDQNYVLENLTLSHSVLYDARSPARFSGSIAEAKPQLRAGRIPHSKNIHYSSILDDNFCFLPISQLQERFMNDHVSPLIFSCGSGITACILAQAAYMIGSSNLAVYDGSWSQWGGQQDLPITLGSI